MENKAENKVVKEMTREITDAVKAKSQITKADLTGRGYIPTLVWFERNDYGSYNIRFELDSYEIKSDTGAVVRKSIWNDRETMDGAEMDFLIFGLNVPSERLKKFACKGYLRLIRTKGTGVNPKTDEIRNYDFMSYELFIVMTNAKLGDDNIFYHRPVVKGKSKALSWATTKNFLVNSSKPYFLRTHLMDESEEDGYVVNA